MRLSLITSLSGLYSAQALGAAIEQLTFRLQLEVFPLTEDLYFWDV